jgi:hypothetical protein
MKITFAERISITHLFPAKANLTTMRLVSDITRRVSFSEEEKEKYGIVFHPDGRVEWTNGIDSEGGKKEFTIEFNKPEIQFLKDRVQVLDSEGAITMVLLDLCERIKQEELKD